MSQDKKTGKPLPIKPNPKPSPAKKPIHESQNDSTSSINRPAKPKPPED